MTTTDLDEIAQCLAHCQSHARGLRRAGLQWMLDETTAALEALARVRQPRFRFEPRAEPEQEEKKRSTG